MTMEKKGTVKITRKSFLKTLALTAASVPFGACTQSGGKEKAVDKRKNTVIFESDFVPEGASLKLAFVADHHYWPDHYKNWGSKQFRHTKERMLDLVKTLNREKPDISIHGGDVIDAGSAFQPPHDEYIKQLDFEKKFIDSLNHPAIPVIGNHEVPDPIYESESELDEWRSRFGDPYGYRDINSWRLIWLNSLLPNPNQILSDRNTEYGIDDTQMSWLKKLLDEAESASIPVLLFAHVPPEFYLNKEAFGELISSYSCAKAMLVGHEHKNYSYTIGSMTVLSRVANVCSPMGYNMVYPYPDGRVIVVQKSQHFPYIDYISDSFSSGAQGSEADRYLTLGGTSTLSPDRFKVIGENAVATIQDGHFRLESGEGKAFVLIDIDNINNARICFSAAKDKASHMGVIACASDDSSNRVEGVLTSKYGPDGNMYLASYTNGEKNTLARSWFNIIDGVAYGFNLEIRNGKVVLANKNMPSIEGDLPDGKAGKFGFFIENGAMYLTDLKIESLES